MKMNDFGLNTHHGALGLHAKNSYFFGFAACKKVTVTSYFFKFATVTSSFLKVTCPPLHILLVSFTKTV